MEEVCEKTVFERYRQGNAHKKKIGALPAMNVISSKLLSRSIRSLPSSSNWVAAFACRIQSSIALIRISSAA